MVLAAIVVAAVPAVAMAVEVGRGTRLQYADYWFIVHDLVRTDGSLRFGELLTFRNEHPVVVAKLLYWLNLRAAHGSNVALGIVVVAIAAAEVVVYGLLLRATAGLRTADRCLAVAATSFVVFAPHGAWNFLKAMSGAAWLPANLLCLVALLLLRRERPILAAVAGLGASVSYGTGAAVWPALLVAALVARRPRRDLIPMAVGAVATALLHLTADTNQVATDRPSPVELVSYLVKMLGSLLAPGSEGTAALIGSIGLVALFGTAALLVVRRVEAAAPWLGVATFGLGGLALMSWGRATTIVSPLQSRYAAPAGAVWIATIVLVTVAARHLVPRPEGAARLVPAVAASLAILVAVPLAWTGHDTVERLHAGEAIQDQLEIAIRLGIADGSTALFPGYQPFPEVTPMLEATGHYPFVADWDRDCDLLGTTVPADRLEDAPRRSGSINRVEPLLDGGVLVAGGIRRELAPRCVVVLDPDGVVVGAAVLADSDRPRTPYRGVALADRGPYRVAVSTDDRDRLLVIGQR